MLRLLLPQLLGRRGWQEDISAYLDDELTPRERERVEARLAESEEARAYLDDLHRMRSTLRGFAADTARAPFQLSVEMLEPPVSVPTQLHPSPIERALRVSMATAAVGIATFSAVLIFDVIDQPSVSFSQGFDSDDPTSVPTVEVVTEQVQQEATAASAAQPSVTVISIEAAEQADMEQADMQQSAAGFAQASSGGRPPEPLEQEAEQAEQEWQAQAYQQQSFDQAAADPARRGINARGQSAPADSEDVDAADVVAQQEQRTVEAGSAPPAGGADSSAGEFAEERESVEDSAEYSDDSAAADAAPQTGKEMRIETRTVAASIRHTESDWPLEQRPRTTSVRLAADPSWEQPLQIALAAVAVTATLVWLCLAMMDRRRI